MSNSVSPAQFEFRFSAPKPAASDEVAALTQYLHANPSWHTAKQLSHALQINDRKIRQFAEASDGRIISGPGCPGYRHIDHCSADDIAHAADKLRSQARRMLSRSIRIRRRAHSLIR